MSVSCKICFKTFSTQSSVNRHLKKIHKLEEKNIISHDGERFNSKCLEEGCHTSYRFITELRQHLVLEHNINMEKEVLYFLTIGEFECWFNNICQDNNLEFVRYKQKGEETIYFNCNRSGKYVKTVEVRRRAMKSQGSCKIGSQCTSQIIMTISEDKKFCATFYKTHYGHSIDIQHIRVSQPTRINIAAKLTSGVSVTRVLDTYRSSFLEDKLCRSNLITRKDINNIKNCYHINIQDGVRHENDSVSVDLLIDQCKEVGDGVLFYKKQGQAYPKLKEDDFCVIFMNQAQKNLMEQFGNSIIAIDSTHGLNNYDFELTTVMVVDEFGEGFPVACMFTNRQDTIVQEIFFDCIKMKVGVLNPKVFMSDITTVYYNAWIRIMGGGVKNRLLCSWHVDRAWRTNLSKISRLDKRKEVYQMLKVLQNCLVIEEFERNVVSVLKLLKDNLETRIFGNYFSDNYFTNRHMWAYCYRKRCGINTNMILESMHKTIKYFYLEGKVVKRLDKGITAVLKYVRDKMVSRVIKITKGVNNSHIQNIHKRHRTALTGKYEVILNEENIWTLKFNSVLYIVSKKEMGCIIPNCQLKCSFCNICIHNYECTCPDFYIRATMCKHIHYIILNSKQQPKVSSEISPNISEPSNVEATKYLLPCLTENSIINKKGCKVKGKITEEINKITVNINQYNENVAMPVLPHVLKTLQNANSLLSMTRNNDSTYKKFEVDHSFSAEPPNKKLKKQASFFSTKKKIKKKNNMQITKPSSSEVSSISSILSISSDHDYC